MEQILFLLDAKDDLFSFGDGQFMSNVSFFNQRDTAMLHKAYYLCRLN